MPTPLAVRKGLPACMAHSACLVHRHPGSALAAAREFAFCVCVCVCVRARAESCIKASVVGRRDGS